MSAPRLVLDTNVCLDLIVFADPRVAALGAALRAGEAAAVTREDCRDEWRRVLRYPSLKLDHDARTRCEAEFDARVVRVDAATPLERPGVRLPRCADADDQKFLELALQAGAIALLTRDAGLLALAGRARRDGLFDIVEPQFWKPPARA